MAQRMNPGLLGSAVLCFALTIAFAGGVFSKSSDLQRLRDGDPARPTADTVPKLLDTRTAMRREIEGMERDVLLRQKELERADVDLGRHLVYWKHTELLGGIATPGNESATIQGKQQKLKEHRLAMARFSLEESGRRLEALKAEYQSDQRQAFPALDKAIASRNTELQVVNQKISEQDALFQKDRTALAEKLDALKAETDKFGKEQATERSRRLTRITQLEDRIRQLLELDLKWMTEIETVGSILSVEDRSNRVIIDLGTSERAFPGLLFEAFTYEKGAYVEKGMLEVIEAKAGISVADLQSVEINEAFASVAVAFTNKLGLDANIVNVNGSGCSLGHPIGCTGARMIVTMVNELIRTDSQWGAVAMCAAGGMGSATVIERV